MKQRSTTGWPHPGMHDNVPADVYHATAAVSSTGILDLLDSPSTFAWWATQPGGRPSTQAMEIGTAAHAYVLEPKEFERRYYLTEPGFTRGRKGDKEGAEQMEAAGRRQLKRADFDLVRRIADAVYACHPAREILDAEGAAERSAAWIDAGGVPCRARFDLDRVISMGLIADFKTASDPHPDEWCQQAEIRGKAVQAAWYPRGYLAASSLAGPGQEAEPDFVWIVAPRSEPVTADRVWVGRPSKRWLAAARDDVERALDLWRACAAAGKWPGYMATTHDLAPYLTVEPPWYSRT